MALQTHTIRLMTQQANVDEIQVEDADDAWLPDGGAAQPTMRGMCKFSFVTVVLLSLPSFVKAAFLRPLGEGAR